MKNFICQFIKRFFVGAAFGVLVNQIIFLIILKHIGTISVDFDILFKQFLASCLAGGVPVGLSAIYVLDNLSILGKISIHFIIGIVVYLFVGSYAGWFSINLGTVIMSIVIFITIWSIFYFIEKKKIEKINKALNKKNK